MDRQTPKFIGPIKICVPWSPSNLKWISIIDTNKLSAIASVWNTGGGGASEELEGAMIQTHNWTTKLTQQNHLSVIQLNTGLYK